ncbi:Kinesin-related Protein [Chondrus crispus]|uniref:Kinesin-like protein n=1 Tax=Chondrus crispus TaxID=2769 RepID=R7Q663_CHOCR|nr:Kinesin-related Protein [Chondrus crispus]CDF34007.1 Kinesin-related Protein [Chondrus crispus]|eukprot:XP_005713826.1 Kinesin-related Protein [Chondrus crispus]
MLGTADDPGLTPRAIQHVLRTVEASKTRLYLVRVAYVEIYNDKIRDLQNPTAADLAVREDKAGRVFVDAAETVVESLDDAIAVLEKGQAVRHVGETKMNARSSRSHTVFTLQIESKGGEGVDQSFRASSLNLVDLAGSERLKSTGAEGIRQKEGAHINKSLLTLGTIIHTLSEHAGKPGSVGHLPYRNSKLTRLLRPALGGNAKTAVLCAITPSKLHVEETLSTLNFAERAKKVTNSASRNEVVDYRSKYKEAATELAVLRDRFTAMEAEVASIRTGGGDTGSMPNSASLTEVSQAPSEGSVNLASGVDTANAIAMSVELQASREEVSYLKEHVDEVETENEHLRDQLKKKSTEFRGLRSRALELRSAARKAKHSERAVRRALVVSFRKLEEAREQLDISRKKGAHVKIAEGYLGELSESLKSWLPAMSIEKSGSTESLTPPTSEAQDDAASKQSLPADSPAGHFASSVSGSKRRSSSATSRNGRQRIHEGNTLRGTSSVRAVRRKPRPLPEDMVADIDDSEAETDHPMPLDDEDDIENMHDSAEDLKLPPGDLKTRISDVTRDVSNIEKPKKKPKGWKAFKNFYGYGYTERGVYDKMIAGHKVPSSAAHISA